MKYVGLDLFKLHSDRENIKGSTKIILTSSLKEHLKTIFKEIKTKHRLRSSILAEKLGINYTTLRMSFKRNRVPLSFVKRLLEYCSHEEKSRVMGEIEEMSSGTGNTYIRVRMPKFLTENICKIAGAVIADGNLYLGKSNRKWSIKIADQYKDNLELFSNWLDSEFGVRYEIKEDKKLRMFYIEFSNKIIFNYLNKILDVKAGEKSSSVHMPEIIRESPLNYQVAFSVGLCMFDGSVGFTRLNFSFNTKSKVLIQEFNEILRKLNIVYSFNNKRNVANGLYQTFVWSRSEIAKILNNLIETNTTKWKQLNTMLNGLENSNMENLKLIKSLYPRPRKSCIGLSDVIGVFEGKYLTKKEIQSKLNRSERTTRSLLNSLERMKILKSKFVKSYKVWKLNSNLNQQGGDEI